MNPLLRRAVLLSVCGIVISLGACAGSTETSSESELSQDSSELSSSPASQGAGAGRPHPHECTYRDVEHCQRGHEGWRWSHREERPPRGGVIDEPEECCVLVGPERPGPTGADLDELLEEAHESKRESSRDAPSECNRNDEWHCRRAHQGWRWVDMQRPPRRGGVSNEPRRCCVLVGPASEQWGYYR